MNEILEVSTEPAKTAQTPAPATEPSGYMSPNGDFREGAPDVVANLLEAKKWTNIEQMATAYGELEKFKGIGEHLVIPEAEDAEGWKDVYNKLGRPETSDKYELAYEGEIPISEELTGQFKEFAHGLGLTQKQFNDVVNFQLEAIAASVVADNEQSLASKEANIAALKSKWGEANFNAKVTGARIIADSLGIYETLEAKGLASDPVIIEMLDTIANRTSEDTITPSAPPAVEKSLPDQLAEIKKSEAFMDKFHRDHKKIMAAYMSINQQIANSGQSQRPRT